MPTNDAERREVARRLRELPDDSTYPDLIGAIADHDGWYAAADAADRLADLIDPPYPDAMASYKGWMAEVYDPDGVLVSPSNVAADLVRAHADGKMLHFTKEEQNEYSAMLEKMSVELHPVDRDALLALADEMERMPQCELCPAEIVDCSAHPDGCPDALLDHYARRIRKALGVVDGQEP